MAGRVAALPPGPPPTDELFEGEVLPAELTPLEYMLKVMNNPRAEADRRDRMAVAAAPFVHGKMGEKGKKDAKREAAASAGGGRFASAPPPPRTGRVN
ncbi:terminase small subunit [Luteibacter jiangsuensis]|uniref:Terminase small subunit n=1 Tax=Luteibacter jiangsuensis TaxID=637577 RepID=A0ABX0Q9X9_9GAMM|nr:terminase small subunit [Luteibacter jiangsuensis]NID06644.1 terminase small subunit [Luteibacter jiangsuensis]